MEQLTTEQAKVKYNTWLVCINIDNTKENVSIARANGDYMLVCSREELLFMLVNDYVMHDTISWADVDLDLVREHFAELLDLYNE